MDYRQIVITAAKGKVCFLGYHTIEHKQLFCNTIKQICWHVKGYINTNKNLYDWA